MRTWIDLMLEQIHKQKKIKRVGFLDPREKGIGVSTVDSYDLGYETALIDANGVHPVERYETLEEAKQGHKEWVEDIYKIDGKELLELGSGRLEPYIPMRSFIVKKIENYNTL